jgi:hypothetical protein
VLAITCSETPNGRVISRTTVQRVTNLELQTNEVKRRCEEYNECINELLKDDGHVIIPEEDERTLQDWDDYTEDNDPDFASEFNEPISDEAYLRQMRLLLLIRLTTSTYTKI